MRMLVLVNGTPTDSRLQKACLGGDPLSPYLFLIVMEDHSFLVSKAEKGGFINGFKVGGRGEKECMSPTFFL